MSADGRVFTEVGTGDFRTLSAIAELGEGMPISELPITAVDYRIGGTAGNGVDYAALPESVNIPAGQRAVELVLVPLDDALPEQIETVVLDLSLPPDATLQTMSYVVGSPAQAAAVIVDNNQPRPVTRVLPDRSFHIMRPGLAQSYFCHSHEDGFLIKLVHAVRARVAHTGLQSADELTKHLSRRTTIWNCSLHSLGDVIFDLLLCDFPFAFPGLTGHIGLQGRHTT